MLYVELPSGIRIYYLGNFTTREPEMNIQWLYIILTKERL